MSATLAAREPVARYVATPPLLQHFDQVAQAPGGITRLRELILTLAVQGKLVPQDPTDEPASVLLERIRAEKARLVKEGKIRKEKPLAAIDDEETPFCLPLAWEWERLGHVVDVIRGITFPANEKTKEPAEGRIGCLRTTNIQDRIEWDDLLFIDRSFMVREEQIIQRSDIVMSMANSRELVGKVAIVKEIPIAEATIGGFLSVLRPHSVLPQFLMIVLRTQYTRSSLIDSASQTTNIANISLGKLNPLLIPVPSIAEQSRIVARVDELMALCDTLEETGRLAAVQHERLAGALFDALANSATAEEATENWQRIAPHFDLLLDRTSTVDRLEQTILQLAVRGLLVPQNPADEPASALLQKTRQEKDHQIAAGKIKRDKPLPPISDEEKPFELPEGWEWVALRDLLPEFQNGASSRGDTGGSPITVLRLADIKNRRISLSDTREIPINERDAKKYGLQKGDILIVRVNGSADIVGQFILNDDELAAIYCDHFIRMRIDQGVITPRFLSLFGESDIARSRIQSLFITTAGQKTVNQAHIGSLLLPLPPLPEQSRIVARVTELRALCAQLRERLAATARTQSRLAEAFVDSLG
ncbi:type I restriction enzyme S subunit [Azonexus fungiphilus]|uniref:Type I restriction enzyme S subunit n=1 Tax=Azonexus fungiphilus TaxID=146940 RepID=A0A495WAM7_9RHOO|nr:restriction endonuclease subunit S [Azonexus fungiphilus]RKT58781.1 type I restriction enzyme S subunit [Azonexus fungiphilus]